MLYTVMDLEGTSKMVKDCIPLCVSYLTFKSDLTNVVDADTLFFYRDGIKWSDEAEEIHHLTRPFLSQFIDDYHENCRKLFKVMKCGNLIGQNLKNYDLPILDKMLAREDYVELDVVSIGETMYTLGKRKQLGVLTKELGIEDDLISLFTKKFFSHTPLGGGGSFHSSEFDVVATALVYLAGKRLRKY